MVVSRQKYCVFGAHLMANMALPNFEWVSNNFPLLTSAKLIDQDVLVHSLGCSVWNTFGHDQGYMAVVECPAPGTSGADIRSDSGWFEMHTTKPLCLIEFERYDGSKPSQLKLEEKLKNLLESAQRWQHSPIQLVLSTWSQGLVNAPDVKSLKNICKYGFTSSTGNRISAHHNLEVTLSRFIFIKILSTIALDRIHNEVLL